MSDYTIRLTIKVQPQAGKQELLWDEKQQVFKCKLKSAPEKNKANEELCSFITKLLGKKMLRVVLVSGATSRRKTVVVTAVISEQQVWALLGRVVEEQKTVF